MINPFTRLSWRWLHWFWRLPLLLLVLIILLLLLWRVVPVTFSAFMLQQQVAAWLDPEHSPGVNQVWVDWEDISPQLMLAVIASEDQRFPLHAGIDHKATLNAIQAALAGDSSGGGSTITQQVAKNLFLWSGRSYVRKGMEWGLALLIERLWDKRRILEVYLNIAQFSTRDYGVGAASRSLLHTTPDRLTRQQAALLAAALPAPSRYDVAKPSRYVRKSQTRILRQMQLLGGLAYLDFLSLEK
ncbi:MAG TPA: monofunctional biosynthetic peptidoglycan transglycosylase [Thiolinea sp.]|nr:monofunctional biosynthetic peptidoglycan transglycosylase [Thiolinea sp.]